MLHNKMKFKFVSLQDKIKVCIQQDKIMLCYTTRYLAQ